MGAGPSSSELEALRRRIFGRDGGSAADVAQYELLLDRGRSEAAAEPRSAPASAGSPSVVSEEKRSTPLRVACALLVAVPVLVVAAVLARPAPVHQLPIPALAGQSIAAYGRTSDPAVGPRTVTYQPEGYSVFQAAGRVVHVAFRCVGEGQVRVVAGSVYRFACTGTESHWVRTDHLYRIAPFVIVASTTGDVVWSVRVVLRKR